MTQLLQDVEARFGDSFFKFISDFYFIHCQKEKRPEFKTLAEAESWESTNNFKHNHVVQHQVDIAWNLFLEELQMAREEERERIRNAIIGMWHKGEVVSYRIDSEFAGIAVPISKVLGLLASTPVTSSKSK